MTVIKRKYYTIYNDMPRGWYRGNEQPYWHMVVYRMWIAMHDRCKNPENRSYKWYKDSIISSDLDYLSNYVKFILNESEFEHFAQTCDKISWSIDKDIKSPGNKNYYPEFMTLTTQQNNLKDRATRKGSPNKGNFRPLLGISLKDGSFLVFNSVNEVKAKGFHPSAIAKVCQGKQKAHKGYEWHYLDIIKL